MPGLFITLEGIDGSGKSTQLGMLARALGGRKVDVVYTREPGGTPAAERIRELLASASEGLAAEAELFLLAAARAQHVAELIRPALEANRTVISDRFIDSSVAFQGYGRGLDIASVDEVNRIATGGLLPDLTILFDLEVGQARARLDARRLRRRPAAEGSTLAYLDQEETDFHERVRAGYLKLAASDPGRIRVVDASGPREASHKKALSLVLPLLKR